MFLVCRCETERYEATRDSLPERGPDAEGLAVRWTFSTKGWYVVFEWPDWPNDLFLRLEALVNQQVKSRNALVPVADGSVEWGEACAGLRNDRMSAGEVFKSFKRHFGERLRWVKATRTPRGVVSAHSWVDGLGPVGIRVTWRDVWAGDLSVLRPADRTALEAAVKDLLSMARSRVGPLLDELKARLQTVYGEQFRGLYVFGSYARPDAGIELPESSDLDVALILSDFESPYEEIERYGDIAADLSLEHSLVISVKAIREADYKEKRTNFTRVISEYAIPVA
jgi:uncharacterized protein